MDKHLIEETEKYIRHFISKYFLIIIQSRKRCKIENKTKLNSSGSDWFNLALTDESIIASDLKLIWDFSIQSLLRNPIVLDIVIKKIGDNQSAVLESWLVKCEPTDLQIVRPNYIYFKMSTLLKTLLSVTRVLPLYYFTQCELEKFGLSTSYRFSRSENTSKNYNLTELGMIRTSNVNINLAVNYTSFKVPFTQNEISQVLRFYSNNTIGFLDIDECGLKSNVFENLESSGMDTRSVQPMSETSSTSISNNDIQISSNNFSDASNQLVHENEKSKSQLEAIGDMPSELDIFYKECKDASELKIFEVALAGDLKLMLKSINEQIAEFDLNSKQFDIFLTSIN